MDADTSLNWCEALPFVSYPLIYYLMLNSLCYFQCADSFTLFWVRQTWSMFVNLLTQMYSFAYELKLSNDYAFFLYIDMDMDFSFYIVVYDAICFSGGIDS
jgi:hypothetical protein